MKRGKVNLPKLAGWSAAMLLAGCATTSVPATQTIDIPIFTSCVKMEISKPNYEFDKLPAGASDGAKILALAADWAVGRKYDGQLEAAIAGCR